MKRIYIYVDGFNLYYGSLKETPYRWLNLKTLFQSMLNSDGCIEKINYYSAHVSGKISEGASARQHAYVSAIKTIPELEVHWGSFLATEKYRPKVPVVVPKKYVKVALTEEKGSDVNLASHLINDGWKDLYDVAVVVSSNSDLIEPIRIVKDELKKTIGIISPHDNLTEKIKAIPPSFVRHISSTLLRKSQFPDILPKTNIKKPDSW
ncbi:MAG: NYN domain-containing protein [Rickettsiales bacterium]|jgi:uncharacterized LabA/DUF88 family protein